MDGQPKIEALQVESEVEVFRNTTFGTFLTKLT